MPTRGDGRRAASSWTGSLTTALPDTKGAALHAALREAILSGQIKPGDQVNAREVAHETGVSAIPVREALHRLAAEGLVTIRPHVGAFVTELPADELAEYLEIRLVLECLAIEKAVSLIEDGDLVVLEGLLARMDEDLAAADWSAYARDNRSFHRAIYGFCHSRALLSEIDRLFALSERGRALFALDPSYAERSQAEHQDLMRAIRARDAAQATAVMARHRRRNLEALRERSAYNDGVRAERAEQEGRKT